MLSQELLNKVRRIEFSTRKFVDELTSGQYKSHFKGHGVQFSEHRVYVAGDDIRHIDWKVSARSREPLIKQYEEEREIHVMLVIDVSGSKTFGSHAKPKSEVAAEIAAMLAFAAIYTGDKVGALFFSDKVEKVIIPKRGRSHVQRIIRDTLEFKPKQNTGTDITLALDSAGRVMKHKGVIFVLSDFLDAGYDSALKRLSRKHDVVAISITDPRESELPATGMIWLSDPETGKASLVDTQSYHFKKWFKPHAEAHEKATEQIFKSSRVEWLKIKTHEAFADMLLMFFRKRKSKAVGARRG